MPGKRSIKKIALVHFLPLELYPPVMNLVNFWECKHGNDEYFRLNVYTSPFGVNELAAYKTHATNITIKHFGLRLRGKSLIKRMLHYFLYYASTVWALAVSQPDTVLYYDSISSFPAWCYKTFFNRSCRIFIHYHEYMSKEEYSGGMLLLKWFHRLESDLYKIADWLSHTNKERMKLFAVDFPGITIVNQHTLPNYPPQSWAIEKNQTIHFPVRFVQVGAMGMDTMYTREFADWVIAQNGRATWDIYSLTIDDVARDYLISLKTPYISLKGKVNYNELAEILKLYDIGLILYKGHIPNYIFNAPNKMFEYHVCGLDVWYPRQMLTAGQYTTTGTFPRIIPVNFENLSLYELNEMVSREGLIYKHDNYTAESALTALINELDKPISN